MARPCNDRKASLSVAQEPTNNSSVDSTDSSMDFSNGSMDSSNVSMDSSDSSVDSTDSSVDLSDSSVGSSALYILILQWPMVRIPSTPSMFLIK